MIMERVHRYIKRCCKYTDTTHENREQDFFVDAGVKMSDN